MIELGALAHGDESERAGRRQSNGARTGVPLISNDKLKQLYSTMLKCRTLEERARVLFKQSKFTGNYYAAVGQEAAAVGTAIDLRAEDTIGPSHRDFITGLHQGRAAGQDALPAVCQGEQSRIRDAPRRRISGMLR